MAQCSPVWTFSFFPEMIRLAVMMSVRVPLALCMVGDLLQGRGFDICLRRVRFWLHGVGPMLAVAFRQTRVEGLRSIHRRRPLDEAVYRINGDRH